MRPVADDPDRFAGEFTVTECGRWEFARRGVDRPRSRPGATSCAARVEAGQPDLAAELAEGARLLGVDSLDVERPRWRGRRPDPSRRDAARRHRRASESTSTPRSRASAPGTSCSRGPSAGSRGVAARAAAARGARLRRRVPAADPPDRHDQPQGPQQHACTPAPVIPAARGRSADADGGHTAVHPDLGTIDDFDRLVRDRRRARARRSRSTSPSSARPTTRGSRSTRSGSRGGPTEPCKYAENPPKRYEDIVNFDFDSADRRRAVGRAARRGRVLGRPRRAGLPGRQPAHEAVRVLGVADRATSGPHHPEVVFLAEAFTTPAR